MTGKFYFKNNSVEFKLKNVLEYRSFFPLIFIEENFDFRTITYIFCDDEFLKSLNNEFLKHNTYTDILTFSLSDNGKPIIAEIYISVDRIRENASIYRVSFEEELERVMIHGCLHLCGYEDHTKDLKANMRARENYYLKKLKHS